MPAELWPSTHEEYHADTTSLSRSQAALILESPALYYGQCVTKEFPRKTSVAMEFGTEFDAAILRPGRLGSGIVVIPQSVLAKNGSRAGAAYAEFAADYSGCVLVKPGEPIHQMVRALYRHDRANQLLNADGDYQHTIRWDCEETGVRRRARFDKWIPQWNVIVDLKTAKSADPKEFAKSAYAFKYHSQASWYCDAAEALYGKRPTFLFIVCEKEPPYTVEVFELDDAFVEMGREDNLTALCRYKRCLETGVWQSPSHGQIVSISAPSWAHYANQWSY